MWAYKQNNCARCFEGSVRYFTTEGLNWENVVGICTDGAPAMLGSRSGYLKLDKKHNPKIVGMHCMIHRQALASKSFPDPFRVHQQTVINIGNFVKGSALDTRLFRNLCTEMDAIHDSLLYNNEVRCMVIKGESDDQISGFAW